MLDRVFRLSEHGASVHTEVVAGITTFLTMAYIIFVQPAVLSGAGMDFGAVMVATCLSAALATTVMGLWARYPIALASGMGQNFFFVFTVTPAIAAVAAEHGWSSQPWQVAMGVVFVSGCLFLLLTLLGVREAIMDAISPSMKHAIAVGIGLFIALIGLKNAGLIVGSPETFVTLNTKLYSPDLIVFFFGLVAIAVLHTWKVRGSILWGILAAAVLACLLKAVLPHSPWAEQAVVANSGLVTKFEFAKQVVAAPPSVAPTAFQFDLVHAFAPAMIPYVILFLFMDVFDTIGTLIGVTGQAGLLKDNRLPRAGRAMLADALGTVTGAALGTSTVTSYIESAAGVEQGGRTGLTAVVVAIGFLLALFFSPIIRMVGSYEPITAPALVIVGAMMTRNVARIDWDDYSESIPAFVTMVGIPFCFNIGDGLAMGFILYPIVKLLSGRWRDASWLMVVLAVVLIAYFVLLRAGIG
jgi:AGZA family xanthine/uracil permease-like MFS transporter